MQFYFAPMEGVTGYVFRQAQFALFGAADKYFSPFISPTQNYCFASKELKDVLADKSLTFVWEDSVLDVLVKDSYSVAYGARNLRRYIQKNLEDPIATKIIEIYLNPISALKAVEEDGKIKVLSL